MFLLTLPFKPSISPLPPKAENSVVATICLKLNPILFIENIDTLDLKLNPILFIENIDTLDLKPNSEVVDKKQKDVAEYRYMKQICMMFYFCIDNRIKMCYNVFS